MLYCREKKNNTKENTKTLASILLTNILEERFTEYVEDEDKKYKLILYDINSKKYWLD